MSERRQFRYSPTTILALLFLVAGAVVFFLQGVDYGGVEMAWGFFLTTCGFIIERLD